MDKVKPQTLKGFRDFLPEEMALRQKVIDTLKEVFESYGFEPLETPALEYAETLLGKSGEETEKLIYSFKDKGGRKVGLRYDLTVPVSRVLAQYQGQIPLPFQLNVSTDEDPVNEIPEKNTSHNILGDKQLEVGLRLTIEHTHVPPVSRMPTIRYPQTSEGNSFIYREHN